MFGDFQNKVKVAIERLGGPTKAAHLLGVSNATVHSWARNQRVPNIDLALKMAKASGIEVTLLRRTR